MKIRLILAIGLSTIGVSNAALTIRSTNLVGFDSTTSGVVDNAGNAIVKNTGFVGIGTFGSLTDAQIQALNTASLINDAFSVADSDTMNGSIANKDGLWDVTMTNNGNPSGFAGLAIFTVIGNGSNLSTSTEFLIYRNGTVNSTGLFNESPNSNGDAVVAVGSGSTGNLVVGGHGNFTYDFGAGVVDAFNLVTVPEPSSTALLGLGMVGFIIRRRR